MRGGETARLLERVALIRASGPSGPCARHPSRAPPWERGGRGRREGAEGAGGGGAGVDAGGHGEAWAELGKGCVGCGDADADGDALDDLGEVAGRVLGREKGEGAAGAGSEAVDGAVQAVAAEHVDVEVDRFACAHVGELRFLEVGDDVEAGAHGDEAEQFGAGLDVCAGADGAVADDAVDGRANGGVGEVELGLVLEGAGAGELGGGPGDLRLQHDDLLLGVFELGPGVGDGGLLAADVGLGLLLALDGAGAGADEVGVAGVVGAGEDEGGVGAGLVGLGAGDGAGLELELGLEAGAVGFGGGDVGASLVECGGEIAVVEAGEDVAGVDFLVVQDEDVGHLAGEAAGDGHHVGGDVGVVGRLHEAAVGPPAGGVEADGGERDAGEGDEDQAPGPAPDRDGWCGLRHQDGLRTVHRLSPRSDCRDPDRRRGNIVVPGREHRVAFEGEQGIEDVPEDGLALRAELPEEAVLGVGCGLQRLRQGAAAGFRQDDVVGPDVVGVGRADDEALAVQQPEYLADHHAIGREAGREARLGRALALAGQMIGGAEQDVLHVGEAERGERELEAAGPGVADVPEAETEGAQRGGVRQGVVRRGDGRVHRLIVVAVTIFVKEWGRQGVDGGSR